MEQPQLPQKSTPARRRAKRPVHSPAARKTYASENDMPSEATFPIELGGPFTPQKSASNSPAPSSQPNQTKSKPRNGGNKARAKQVSSPAPTKQGRTTPPHTIASKSVAAPAFAGATFHASPAPSSLPIPSFLAKALDSPSVRDTSRASREPSPPATDSEAPTPQNRLLPTGPARQESPLDIFFNAHRAEKERARRASSANILAVSEPIPFSPPTQSASPPVPKTLPSGFGARARRPGFQRNPSGGISASELDGTPGRPMGPAFSTPYQDRIRAARSSEKPAEPAQIASPPQEQVASLDLSEKLKRFLAIPPAQAGAAAPQNHSPTNEPPVAAVSSPASTSSSMPTASPDTGRSPQILNMENSLRQLLGIDAGLSGLSLGAIPPRQPANYQSS
ncbi:hypothetical protein MMYC01_203706 [Madurella mycetomatis]|uniref:Proteophosphoglycan 5 n=1 Tax=Madurella mycetomatis TaxID=100816 RepID=A0A175W7Q0_9PEZI|nr:hypothetical protein MMYC01_203706 [Madurella mycetomatis]